MSLLDFIDSMPDTASERAEVTILHGETVRKKRSNPIAPTGGSYADQLIARIAVDTGAVRLVNGHIVVRDRNMISPVILEAIEEYKPDVRRIVGEMEQAREYGRVYRRERDAA